MAALDTEAARHKLVGLAYQSAVDADAWPDLLAGLCSYFGGSAAFLSERRGRMAKITHHSEASLVPTTRGYDRHWGSLDPNIEGNDRLCRGFVTTSRVTCPHLEKTEFYNEYLRAVGRSDYLILNSMKIGRSRNQILIARSFDDRHFTPDDVREAAFLMPHLQKAQDMSAVWNALAEERNALAAGLDAQASAVVLLDIENRIVHANVAMLELVGRNNGLAISQGRLSFGQPEAARQFNRLVSRARSQRKGGPAGAMCDMLRCERPPPLFCRVATTPDAGAREGMLVATLIEFGRLGLTAGLLENILGLTRTEAAVLLQCCDGRTALEVAHSRGTALSTVQWHLKNALGKMDVRNLREAAWRLGAMTGVIPPQK